MNTIIDMHEKLLNFNYLILDPKAKSNNIKGIIPTQTEIIQHILENKLNKIQISYVDKYIIQYELINQNKIRLSPLEPNSVHLLRLCGLKIIINYSSDLDLDYEIECIYEIILQMQDFINLNPTNLCTVCGCKLKLLGMGSITSCDNVECVIQSNHLVTDNRITDLYKKDPYLCELLITILIQGSKHPKGEKVFKPLPKINNVKKIQDFIQLLDGEKNNLKISFIANNDSNDIELFRAIGSNAYAIISNAISDNYFSLSTIEKTFDSCDVKVVGLNYSYDVESKFKKEYFLFHGSSLNCWYPIIKNGLKIMSGTELMANGAFHGNGIYLTDKFRFSLSYSTKSQDCSKRIVGVFEIADGIEQHKKTNNVYVISNDEIVLLRYLIIIDKESSLNSEILNTYFTKYLGLTDKTNVSIKNKRFNAELKLLNSNPNVNSIDIMDEMTNWKIKLNNTGDEKFILDVYFNDYPRLPPKILLKTKTSRNIIKFICDEESNVIIPEINPSKWDITTNLSKITDIICNCISNYA